MSIQQIRDDVAQLKEAVFGGGTKVSKDAQQNEAAHNVDRAAAIIDPERQVGQTDVPAAEDVPVTPAASEGAGVQGAGGTDQGKSGSSPSKK